MYETKDMAENTAEKLSAIFLPSVCIVYVAYVA